MIIAYWIIAAVFAALIAYSVKLAMDADEHYTYDGTKFSFFVQFYFRIVVPITFGTIWPVVLAGLALYGIFYGAWKVFG